MKLFTTTALCFFFFLIFAGCKKDGSGSIRIEGFDLYDGQGNQVGHMGPDDKDWTFDNTLSGNEMALFNFAADSSLDNTKETTGGFVHAYPIPANNAQYLYINSPETVLLKLVLVNRKLEVLNKKAFKIKGSYSVIFDISDRSVFNNSGAFRIYYSFSATGKPNFKAGYGDIKVCESLDNCF